MKNKKILLYGAIILVFMVFCLINMGVIIGIANGNAKVTIQDKAAYAEAYVNNSIDTIARDYKYAIADLEPEESPTLLYRAIVEKTAPLQDAFDAQGEGYLLFDDGNFYNDSGTVSGFALSLQDTGNAERDGYAYTGLTGADMAWESVALILPVPNNGGAYFVMTYPMGEFFGHIFKSAIQNVELLAVYNEWGGQVYVWDGLDNSQNDANDLKALQYDAMGYSAGDTEPLKRAGRRSEYNVFGSLEQPDGWFLGARVNLDTVAPIYASLIYVAALTFGVWLLLAVVIIGLDIYNDKEKRRELEYRSKTDTLTGLLNSSGMAEAVMDYFDENGMVGKSLVYLDIIGFHRFNTMFGHVVGDMLLRLISGVLGDYYACGTRMSDDVFAFVAESDKFLSGNAEHRIYEVIEKELGRQYIKMISFQFGIYPITSDNCTFREIYDGALLALRNVKLSGDQKEVIYNNAIKESADMDRKIEINMLHALSKEEFQVYIQPKFHIPTENCCGGEALVRWQSEQMGFLAPDAFIPLFEKNGFIVEVDFYMMERVLEILQAEIQSGKKPFPISVNQSLVTITFPNYIERLEALVKNHKAPLELVEIEITESVLESNKESVIPLINEMKRLGFRVAMDDFGAGFSSLNTLRELPVDVLKIDRAFLKESDSSDKSSKIIRNIVVMAKELGIDVVCEGVETASQLAFLKNVGCHIAQGYYFSKPVPYLDYEKAFLLGYAGD